VLPDTIGGLGRVRITAAKDTCTLSGTFTPALSDSCNDAGVSGKVYVSTY